MTARRMSLRDVVGSRGLLTDGDWVESKDQDPNGDVRLVQLADIGDGEFLNKSARFLTAAKARELGCTLLREGDVLVSRMADPLARACVFPGDPKPCVTVVDACIVRADGELASNAWLKYAINSPSFRRTANARVAGATRQRISRGNLQTIELSVPSLQEQQHVVDVLARAEGILRLRREAEAKAQAIVPALFLDMFGDPRANPRGWTTAPLSEVAEVISGVAKGRKLALGEGVELPYMRVANVKDGYLDLDEVKTIEIKRTEVEKLLIQPGDLLMTEGGDPDKLGRAALWSGEVEGCVHQNHVFKVRSNRNRVLPVYLRALAGSAYGKAYFLSVAKKTTGIASINKTQLSAFPVVLPPVDVQAEFAEQVASMEAIVAQQRAAAAKAEAMFESLLARSFGDRRQFSTAKSVEAVLA